MRQVSPRAVELARSGRAAWLVVPCCLQLQSFMDGVSLRLPDDIRYAVLCGAMASAHGATRIGSIDSRITGRGIVLSSLSSQEKPLDPARPVASPEHELSQHTETS